MDKVYESQITTLINTIYEGVNRSSVGPIYLHDEDGKLKLDNMGNPALNSIAYQTYLYLISSMAPKGNLSITAKGDV